MVRREVFMIALVATASSIVPIEQRSAETSVAPITAVSTLTWGREANPPKPIVACALSE